MYTDGQIYMGLADGQRVNMPLNMSNRHGLIAGASGTGKTMAAEALAHALQLDLYRVDLSRIVDKYIGETEKRLSALFDAADATDAILLFDEADALFGKRGIAQRVWQHG